MLYIVVSVLCSVVAALVSRRGDPGAAISLPARAMSFLVMAGLGAAWAAATAEFNLFDVPLLLLGLAAGVTFALAQYLTWRTIGSGQLAVSPTVLTAAGTLPALAGLVLFGVALETSLLAALGGLVLGLILLVSGSPRRQAELGRGAAGTTAFLFLVVALQFFALQFFAEVFLNKGPGLFLMVTGGTAAVALGAMSARGTERADGKEILLGAGLGVLRFGVLWSLLRAMETVSSPMVLALALALQVALVLFLERMLFARLLRGAGYVGLLVTAFSAAVAVWLLL